MEGFSEFNCFLFNMRSVKSNKRILEDFDANSNKKIKHEKENDKLVKILKTDKGYSFSYSENMVPLNEGNYKQIFATKAWGSDNIEFEAVFCKFGFDNKENKGKSFQQDIDEECRLWSIIGTDPKNTGVVEYFGVYKDENSLCEQQQNTAQKVYMVFKKYSHGTLENQLDNIDSLKTYEINAIVRDLLLGLKVLHSKNIVHLDIKPDNILIKKNIFGEIIGASLTDLGLSREIGKENKVYPKNVFRTYAAPEYLEYFQGYREYLKSDQKVSFNSMDEKAFAYDIYSMGIILNPTCPLHPIRGFKE